MRLFATGRELSSSYNRLVSLDTRVNLTHNFFFTGQAVTTRTRPLAGSAFSGNSYYAQIRRSDRKIQYYSSYTDRSPGFRADLGFIPRTDIREFKTRLGYKWWLEKSKLVNFGPAIIVLGNRNRLGQTQDWDVALEWSMEFTRLTNFTYTRSHAFELYKGYGFRKQINYFLFGSEWFKWLAVNADYTHGAAINYYPIAGGRPFLGNSRNASLELTIRPTPRLRIDEKYIYSLLRTQQRGQFAPAVTSVYNNHIVRSKVNYQFTRELSLRAIVDYNGVLPNASLVSLDRTKRVGYDILATYLLHPGTAVYVGFTDIYENLALNPALPPYLTLSGSPNLNTGRQFFVKTSYLLRF